jgi:D-threo-aldose 1-dehydrogenase
VRTGEIGSTGVELTELGFGGGGLGELWVKVPDEQGWATMETAWDGGIRFFDTAPFYGAGLSEHRLGRFLRSRPREEFRVCTKIGRILHPPRDPAAFDSGIWAGGLQFEHVFDYSYDGVMRSYEDSLQRLGLNRVDMLVIHDLDTWQHEGADLEAKWASLRDSGWRALAELRDAGIIGAIGAGVNLVGTGADTVSDVARFIDTCDLDFIIIAGRYTLLDQTALRDLALCREHGIDAIVGAVFNTGILSRGPGQPATFDYQAAPPEIIARADHLDAVCRRHDVPLRAAAIQFPLAHDVVRSVLSGPVAPAEARDSLEAYDHPIPEALWQELRAEGLIAGGAPTPAGRAPHEATTEVT